MAMEKAFREMNDRLGRMEAQLADLASRQEKPAAGAALPTADELTAIKGVGPAMAKDILALLRKKARGQAS
jgi:predicted flap endonuclease-1-like 5' DNA nuclease